MGDEERDLLMAFAEHIGLAATDGRPPEAFRQEVVDGFLVKRRQGFAGYSDDELKGTARDAE